MADALDSLRLMRTQNGPRRCSSVARARGCGTATDAPSLDFTQGLAVNSLATVPACWSRPLARQVGELVSTGPGLLNRPVLALAQRLCLATGSDQFPTHQPR